MRDIYGNKLNIGDWVIFDSCKAYTKIGLVYQISEHSILVLTEGVKKQIFNKNSDILNVVMLGHFIKNMVTLESICTFKNFKNMEENTNHE